jgi:hypothetical protein
VIDTLLSEPQRLKAPDEPTSSVSAWLTVVF